MPNVRAPDTAELANTSEPVERNAAAAEHNAAPAGNIAVELRTVEEVVNSAALVVKIVGAPHSVGALHNSEPAARPAEERGSCGFPVAVGTAVGLGLLATKASAVELVAARSRPAVLAQEPRRANC